MKVLRVGDPHVRPQNLTEATNLMEKVYDTVVAKAVERLEILGDLFHTHAVIRLEVLEFWHYWLLKFAKIVHTVVIVGNHDMSGDYNRETSALTVFKDLHGNLEIIEAMTKIGDFAYMPYYHDHVKFVEDANLVAAQDAKVIVCHQTFNGAKYENGFYAPDGVNPSDINCDLIISGHIHARQRFTTEKGQKVIYPGTAKWDSNSDANEDKGLWLVTHGDGGLILEEEFIPTNDVCTQIISVAWVEGQDQPELPTGAKVNVELVGSSDWILKQKKTLKGKVSVSTRITDQKRSETRKTGNSLEDFIKNVYPSQIDKDKLITYMKELSLV